MVKIGGKERGVKFGTNATAKFCELQGIDLTGYSLLLMQIANGSIKMSDIRDLVYAGLWAYCKSNKEEVDFDLYDVGDWLDEIELDEMKKIYDALAASLPTLSDDKKKVIQTEKP